MYKTGFIKQLNDDLITIRTELVKIGPSRRLGDILIKNLTRQIYLSINIIIYIICICIVPSFDLKVALGLLQLMTEELSVLRQLIDGIYCYSSISDDEAKNT